MSPGASLLLLMGIQGGSPGSAGSPGTAGAVQYPGPFGWPFFFAGAAAPPATFLPLEVGLAAHLATYADLAAIVDGRIYHANVPEDSALPALAYTVLSRTRLVTLDGPSGIADGRVELAAVSKSYSDCSAIVELVTSALNGFAGDLSGVAVIAAWHDDESTIYDPPIDGSDSGTRTLSTDFVFRYRIPISTPR